jgi:hypothetical protein
MEVGAMHFVNNTPNPKKKIHIKGIDRGLHKWGACGLLQYNMQNLTSLEG